MFYNDRYYSSQITKCENVGDKKYYVFPKMN